jgi:hypothetical protein
MKFTKEQKPKAETVSAVDVELNDEQLETLAGGIVDRGDGIGCTGGTIFNPKDIILTTYPTDIH